MSDRIFTDEQLIFISKRFSEIHETMEDVLLAIGKSPHGLALNQIDKEVGISEYVRNKIIPALKLLGLIEMREISTAKLYSLTKEGIRLKELLEQEN